MRPNQIGRRLRVKGWVYGRRLKRYREDVIAYQCHTQKSFSKHNAAVFLLLGIVYMLLDHFLWREFQIGTVFYFIVSLFSAINYLLYQKFLPQHEKWVIPAGCLYIFIMGKFLLSLNLFGGNAMSWTLLLCSLISTSIILIIPAYYAAVMLVVVVMDMVEYAVVNPDMVHIFYNLIDDFVIITFCVGINVIFSKLKYEELDYKEHLFCESSRDPLTMLYNRRYLERYFTERSDVHKTSAFIMLDLDNFKNANDAYGHKKGDEVLCRVSRILSDHFRENDCIARLGGDEFAVFIPEIPETEVIIKRVRSVLHSFPITIIEGETPVEVSVSMGVVLKEAGEAPSYTELCESADEAMYQAKKEGKAKAVITGAGEMQITID